jgi:hypothetical protein
MSYQDIKDAFEDKLIKLIIGAIFTAITSAAVSVWNISKSIDQLTVAVLDLKSSSYNTEFEIIKATLSATSSDHGEVIKEVKRWKAENWGAQLGSLNTLCKETDRVHLNQILEPRTTTAVCLRAGS